MSRALPTPLPDKFHIPGPADLIRIWELGRGGPAWYRSWLMLAPAFPEMRQCDLTALSIGLRNSLLLRLHRELFGSRLVSVARCPGCAGAVEFVLDADELCALEGSADEPVLTSDGFEVEFRLLNSQDLAAVDSRRASGRNILVERAIVGAKRQKAPVGVSELPAELIAEVGEEIARRDPLAECDVHLECPACSHGWTPEFDVVAYVWMEVSAIAERLLGEVCALARAFGWAEADILGMSAVRRRYYLDTLEMTF